MGPSHAHVESCLPFRSKRACNTRAAHVWRGECVHSHTSLGISLKPLWRPPKAIGVSDVFIWPYTAFISAGGLTITEWCQESDLLSLFQWPFCWASAPFCLHVAKEIASTLKCKSHSLGFESVSKSRKGLGNLEGASAYLEFLAFLWSDDPRLYLFPFKSMTSD